MATRRKPTRKNDEAMGSYPLHSRRSSGNSILKPVKISPPFHTRRYKPSATNTPPWSKKDPDCTSLQPSATLPPRTTNNTNSATHLSTVNVNSFQVPSLIVSWRQEQVCPETQRETRSTCPLHPTLKHTHSAYRKRFGSVKFQTQQQQQAPRGSNSFTNSSRPSWVQLSLKYCVCSRENTHIERPNSSKKRNRQTFRCVRVTIVVVKNRSITDYKHESVVFVIQHTSACAVLYCLLWPLVPPYFSALSHKWYNFRGGELLNI